MGLLLSHHEAFSILVNGQSDGHICYHHGLEQEDPLFSFLFILADVLSKILGKTINGRFMQRVSNFPLTLMHHSYINAFFLQYTDDTLLLALTV